MEGRSADGTQLAAGGELQRGGNNRAAVKWTNNTGDTLGRMSDRLKQFELVG